MADTIRRGLSPGSLETEIMAILRKHTKPLPFRKVEAYLVLADVEVPTFDVQQALKGLVRRGEVRLGPGGYETSDAEQRRREEEREFREITLQLCMTGATIQSAMIMGDEVTLNQAKARRDQLEARLEELKPRI